MSENVPTITRHLPVPLDQYRRNALASEQATARMEENRITDHMKRVTESLKVEIRETQKKQNHCALALTQGFEMKEIACRQEIDLEKNKMVTYRLDNGEQVDERALTVEEMRDARKKKEHVVRP